MKHDCDKVIRSDGWAMSGQRETGDTWKCTCGKTYVHSCDEAEGCAWRNEGIVDRMSNIESYREL